MPIAFRPMREDKDRLPEVRNVASGLGLRPRDLTPDETGRAQPGRGGMSVVSGIDGLRARMARRRFPPTLVPRRLQQRVPGAIGADDIRVFCVGEGRFERGAVTEQVVLEPDRDDHGTMQPSIAMDINVFRAALIATRSHWRDGEGDV